MAVLETLGELRWLVLGGLVVAYLARTLYAYNRLRHFKGPWGVGISEFSHTRRILTMTAYTWYEEVCAKYGPLARIGPNSLVTANPEVWAHVHTTPGYKKTDWFYQAARFEYQRDNIFTQTNTEKHDIRRKQIAPGYSGRENAELEASVDRHVKTLIDLLRTKYLSTDHRVIPVDLSKKIQYLTLDIISTIGFGRSFGMLEADSDVDGILAASESGLLLGNTFMAIGLAWLRQAPIIGPVLTAKPEDASGIGRMVGLCYRWADERWAVRATDKRLDMLGSFIKHGLSREDLRSELIEQIIAGSDTTASALRGILLYLMTNPRVYLKLRAEIDAAVADGRAPVSTQGVVSSAAVKQLPYMQVVIREAMRVWPPVVNLFPHDVPPGGDRITVDGTTYFVPGGTEIGTSMQGMMHDAAVFGEDAKAFRPERWFEADKDRLARMTRTADLVFGHGRWSCLGKPIAQLELGKTIFELLRHFDLAPINPTSPWQLKSPLGLFLVEKQFVQVTAREVK
ncbi:pisatin demethylase [Echria macrotheca]|uniref:Pisatin demethylase n=1 Tax=Echria macrotheca TaxID=438768 RepID=A0AAJ0B7M2_9PEZI|nr:pisatin demethylase [Echria macrotheca]